VILSPGREVIDLGTHFAEAGEAYPGRPLVVQFAVTNLGNIEEGFLVSGGDSLGWPLLPLPPGPRLGFLPTDCDTLLRLDIDVPPWAQPDVDTNRIWGSARSEREPWREYEERFELPVRHLDELRDVSATPWSTSSPAPDQPASIEWWLMNTGQLPDDYEITVTDSLGWGFNPPSLVVPLCEACDAMVMHTAIIPPSSFIGEVNRVYLETRSLQSPAVVRRDTVEIVVGDMTAVGDGAAPAAGAVLRHGCRPNPSNPYAEVWFEMPAPGGQARVEIYDTRGRLVRRLFAGPRDPGVHAWRWDGRDASGRSVASGSYLYRVVAGGRSALGKVVISR